MIRKCLFLWIILLIPGASWAAIAFVSGSATSTKTATKSVTSGNLIIAGFTCGDDTSNPTVSDGVNTWTQIPIGTFKDVTHGQSCTMWTANAATTASITITVANCAASGFNGTFLGEYSGAATSSPVEASTAAFSAGSLVADAILTGSTTTVTANDLIVSFVTDDSSVRGSLQFNAGTNFTKEATLSKDPAGGSNITYAVEDRILVTPGSVTGTWTEVASGRTVGCMAAIKPAVAGSSVIKSVSGVAYASMATVSGVAKASISKVAGVGP